MASRILLLEDDNAVAAIYAITLRSDGHEVITCDRFEDARKELKQTLPDALLTDVRVGEYNGLQLALLFRSLSAKGLIVVVSGHGDPVIQQEVLNMGGLFLVKPVDLDGLKRLFRSGGEATL